jgi:hypothetical protein
MDIRAALTLIPVQQNTDKQSTVCEDTSASEPNWPASAAAGESQTTKRPLSLSRGRVG